MEELVSVIIPVYKTEKYLNQCISSVISQTYKNIEIILVDDGSPDKCGEICDQWAKKDKRIKVIHKDNSGAGASRNVGMKIAEGEFIQFVDSDDYISPDMTAFLIGQFQEDVDIVECDWISSVSDNMKFDDINGVYRSEKYRCSEAMRENIKDRLFRQIIWNKMFRRKVVEDVYFPEGNKIDDEFWTYLVIGKADFLIHTDKVLYVYRQHEESVMHVADYRKAIEGIEAKILRHQYICEKMPELEKESLLSVWSMMLYQGQQALKMDFEAKNKILDYIKIQKKKYPADLKDFPMSLKQKFWIRMAEKFFLPVCMIRNMMKIGC